MKDPRGRQTHLLSADKDSISFVSFLIQKFEAFFLLSLFTSPSRFDLMIGNLALTSNELVVAASTA